MTGHRLIVLVAAGALCACSAFASTIIGGVEDLEPNTSTEGTGDYNDLMFSLSGAGLQIVSLDDGTWNSLSGVTLQYTVTNPSGEPFWDDPSLDDTPGSPKNVGYCLETLSSTNNCSLPLSTPAVNEYLSIGNAPDNDFYFTFSGGLLSAVQLARIAEYAPYESLDWYDPLDPSVKGPVFAAGSPKGTVTSFSPTPKFGLYFVESFDNAAFFTQNSLDSGPAAGTSESRFAMFQEYEPSPVPEPRTMMLFGVGAVMLMLLALLKNR